MALLSQLEIETQMYDGGLNRMERLTAGAIEGKRGLDTPVAKKVITQQFVAPVTAGLEALVNTKVAGRLRAYVPLLRGMDMEAVAYLSIRCAFNLLMAGPHSTRMTRNVSTVHGGERVLVREIGRTIYREMVIAHLADTYPGLYYALDLDLAKRKSKDERHRFNTMRIRAESEGVYAMEWTRPQQEQVGYLILGLLYDCGFLERGGEIKIPSPPFKMIREVAIASGVVAELHKTWGYVAVTSPVFGPCVAPPAPWTAFDQGGYITHKVRRAAPYVASVHPSARHAIREAEMPIVYSAINHLQNVAWRVNTRVLDTVLALSKAGVGSDEILTMEEPPKPPPPAWLLPDMKKPQMSAEQLAEFLSWKLTISKWHTAKKLRGIKLNRFYATTRAADMFRDYPAIYFVYFADSRGRFYPRTYGVNPQGSDIQKAMLTFAEGKPLHTATAIKWFHIQGANKWGYDKATLTDRFLWAHERRDLIMTFADDPVNNTGWLEAGDPLQFLAWCFEYADFIRNPDTFVSHIPISMDGSCNGLQNLSAMLRDEVGGKATNLTDNLDMEDIYQRVADAALVRLKESTEEDPALEVLRQKWAALGVARKVVKRSVMCTPYGVTLRSATEYVIGDYLKRELHSFEPTEYRKAATVLMRHVWPAIGDVVVKGRQAMDWMRRGGRRIAKEMAKNTDDENEQFITWRTPSGFIATQSYFEYTTHRINTHLAGVTTMKIASLDENDNPDEGSHSSGLAPNFVHSLDASHLHLTAARCAREGINSLAMIHDDYGTHAADAQALFHIIREEFVAMYTENDPVGDLHNRYPVMGEPPSKGSLDIASVLSSAFFFS